MVLGKVFSPDRILVNLESDDKEEVFEELVNTFCVSVPFSNRVQIITALKEREDKMSTGVKKGIAVPHARLNTVEGVKGVIGISRKGLDYDALDGEPVYVVFMLLSSDKDAALHLRVLKRLAQLLDDPDFCKTLMNQRDSESCYNVVCKFEDKLCSVD